MAVASGTLKTRLARQPIRTFVETHQADRLSKIMQRRCKTWRSGPIDRNDWRINRASDVHQPRIISDNRTRGGQQINSQQEVRLTTQVNHLRWGLRFT